jgi:TolB-like protein/Tfp pilus assembly protein PilF
MSLLQELKRRNVVKVAALYVVASWLVLQAAELLFDAMNVPEAWLRFLIAILLLGFPLILIFSWVFELTPEGVKREKDIDRDASITPQTGQRINTVIIVLLVLAVATIAIDRLVPEKAAEPVTATVEDVAPAATTSENSIAVLPFVDLSAEGDQEYFSDGIAEEILNVLVRIEGLKVASRTTSFGFKGQESLGIPLIAEKMSVRHILEGSVRKAGDTVRITAQLIDAQSDKHLWSETYDRQLTVESIFAIQDEIAGAIVEQLGVLMSTGTGAPEIVADTQNLEAYELYLQAHKLFIERSDAARSIKLFEQAVAVDPAFARAWAGLAAAYVVAPGWGVTDRDYYELAEVAANESIKLDPDLPLSYAALAQVLWGQIPPTHEATLANLDKAVALDEQEATTILWRGLFFMDLGYFDRAARDLTRCLEIDPAYEICRRGLAMARLFAGDVGAAERLYEQGLLKGFNGNADVFLFLQIEQGKRFAVLSASSVYLDTEDQDWLIEPQLNAMTDRSFEFEDVRKSIEAPYKASTGEALDWTESEYLAFYFKNYAAITEYPDNPFWWFPYPEDFKQSPHRKRMIRNFGLFAYWQKHGFPPQCRAVGDDDFECD